MYLWLVAAALMMSTSASASEQPTRTEAPGCTFRTLSAEDQRRYKSRYDRRVRLDGKAFADNWLQEQACPTPAQQAARRQRFLDKRAPCKRTRIATRPSPNPGGGMSMSPALVCTD